MAAINIADVQVGMKLAGDVKARNGRILMRAGGAINERSLKTLKAWGVTEADIEGLTREDLARSALEDADPRLVEQAEERARHIFHHADAGHPFMGELMRICTSRILRNLENGGR